MTIEEFERELAGLGTKITTDAQDILIDVLGEVTRDMARRAPVATGALQRSIGYVVNPDNTFAIQMLFYGPFQNYGVSGTEQQLGLPVPAEVEPIPFGTGNTYQFTRRRFGLPPQPFFDLEQIRDYVATRVEEELANRIEE